MEIVQSHILYETEHWILNHHLASALPGYLMLGTRAQINSLADLPPEALVQMGSLMADVQRIMETELKPRWLYISRYGHMPGLALHFHFIPVYDWVERAFWRDERYRALQGFGSREAAQNLTDGAELTLFIWREFGESPTPPAIEGPAVDEVIEHLRQACRSGLAPR